MIVAARLLCAAVALWFALGGIARTLRAGIRVTAAGVVCLVASLAASSVALWLRLADPATVADVGSAVLRWILDASGADVLWERILEALRQLRDSLTEGLPGP